ncbi:MAG TPA: hypothetical protein VK616_00065, partial [Flavitalea sp.]|nr:hypothetical protein [Flavitalea sp.]
MTIHQHPSSYRDPSGYVFEYDDLLYRQINKTYETEFNLLGDSGLLFKLIEKKWLVSHEEISPGPDEIYQHLETDPLRFKIIKPEIISPLSYPYEWSFDALRDAGLLHLDIMKLALEHGMILKDATPYNVQFRSGHPIFIDTLSFQKYDEKVPWIAYRQFCENFLYPLLLERYRKLYSHQVFAAFPEGIPVDVTARLLPLRSRFNLGCWLHVFLPAAVGKSKNARASEVSEASGASFS